MSEQKPRKSWAAIAVALIGMAGSVAVAWITTQAKFNKELEAKEAEVARMRAEMDATERRLADQNRAAEQRMAEQQKALDAKVRVVDERMKRLDAQLALAGHAVEALKSGTAGIGSLWGGGKKGP